MQTINKHLYDALIEAGASEAKATAASTHDVVTALAEVRNELNWVKKVGGWGLGLLAASVGALYWAMFEMNAQLAAISEQLTQVLDKLP